MVKLYCKALMEETTLYNSAYGGRRNSHGGMEKFKWGRGSGETHKTGYWRMGRMWRDGTDVHREGSFRGEVHLKILKRIHLLDVYVQSCNLIEDISIKSILFSFWLANFFLKIFSFKYYIVWKTTLERNGNGQLWENSQNCQYLV